jgi:hypothetical protein
MFRSSYWRCLPPAMAVLIAFLLAACAPTNVQVAHSDWLRNQPNEVLDKECAGMP